MYGNGNNFVNRVLHAADTKDELLIASDQFGSPTSAKDLARIILYLIKTNEYGTYHATCQGVCNRYEFAQEVLKLAGKRITLRPVVTSESDLSSARPAYAVLDNFILRIINVYEMPDWRASLKEYMDERWRTNMGETQKEGKEENRTYNEDFYCIACRSDIWNYFMLCGSKWTYQRRHYRRRCTVRGRTRLYQTDEDVGCTTGYSVRLCAEVCRSGIRRSLVQSVQEH